MSKKTTRRPDRTIALDIDSYDLYHLIQKVVNGKDSKEASKVGGDALMTFWNDQEYEEVKKTLKSLGVSFRDVGDKPDKIPTASPIPSKKFIGPKGRRK